MAAILKRLYEIYNFTIKLEGFSLSDTNMSLECFKSSCLYNR